MKLLNLLKKIMIPALLVWICIPLKTSASEYGNLLTEPYLQCPTDTTVNVVWFTKSATADNYVLYGNRLSQKAYADTSRLSRIRTFDNQPVNIYRHEAVVTGLPLNKTGNERVPYQAVSDGSKSGKYYLQAQEQAEAPMKILFTSDCQLKEMSAANYEKAVETAGHIDAVFYAGDLVNIPDQADEWFPLENSNAFFSLLQGSADQQIGSTVYHGGSILQEAPIYTAPGNHEFMGRTSTIFDLGLQFNDTRPAKYGDSDNTFNTITYEELFDIPSDQEKLYYAVTIGNVRLVVLNVTRMWRSNEVGTKSAYSEDVRSLNDPASVGGGSFFYEPIKKGSEQYIWLENEVHSSAFQDAGYRIVMFHHAPHGLGGNIIPPFTDPVCREVYDADGQLSQILYDYPKEDDDLINDLVPLLQQAGTDLVLNGHSHIWNRFRDQCGMNYLETSNVGNSYGAYDGIADEDSDGTRTDRIPSDMTYFNAANYVLSGDPGGLEPCMPTIRSLDGKPYIASNTVTVFSLFDTATGIVESYWYDVTKPEEKPVKFDSFQAKRILP